MKKTIALILAIIMMAAIAVPAFAEAVEIPATEGVSNAVLEGAGTKGCVVTYGVTDSYTVSLPSAVSFSFTVNDQVAEVTVSNLVIDGNRKLVVTMGSAQGVGVWQMQADNGSAPVPYTVTGATVAANTDRDFVKPTIGNIANANLGTPTTILEIQSNVDGLGGGVQLTFETEGTKQAGAYSDQITFVVALADKTPAQEPNE